MSETAAPAEAEPQPVVTAEPPVETPSAAPTELPVAFAAFAAGLRPARVPLVRRGKPVVAKDGKPVMTVRAGHPDEIWIKLVKIRHGRERMTPTAWRARIDAMRNEPVHASDPRTARGVR